MPKLIACPRCQVRVDVTDVSPGSSVRCPDCGQMCRIPTGNTSVRTAPAQAPAKKGNTALRVAPVAAPAPAPAAAAPERGGTRMRQRAARPPAPKSSNAGLWIGVAVGVLGLLGGLVFMSMSKPAPEPPPTATKAPPKTVPAAAPAPAPAPAAAPAPEPEAPPAKLPAPTRDAGKSNWDQIMTNLRPGGGFDDPGRPEGAAFKMVKDMGKSAYPHLIKYIDHEDIMIARAAVTVLGELSGKKSSLPNEATRAKIKAEWEEWAKSNP